jgi:hypothetical protein
MFVPGKPFKPSLIFVSNSVTYPSEAPFSAPLLGKLMALPANIRLSGKILPGETLQLITKSQKSREIFYNIGSALSRKSPNGSLTHSISEADFALTYGIFENIFNPLA